MVRMLTMPAISTATIDSPPGLVLPLRTERLTLTPSGDAHHSFFFRGFALPEPQRGALREHLTTRRHPQLRQDRGHVMVRGFRRDVQPLGDLRIR